VSELEDTLDRPLLAGLRPVAFAKIKSLPHSATVARFSSFLPSLRNPEETDSIAISQPQSCNSFAF
jgi:hypothetical protein